MKSISFDYSYSLDQLRKKLKMKSISLDGLRKKLNQCTSKGNFDFASVIFNGPFIINQVIYEGGLVLKIGSITFTHFPTLSTINEVANSKYNYKYKNLNLIEENLSLKYWRIESIGFYRSLKDIVNTNHIYDNKVLRERVNSK